MVKVFVLFRNKNLKGKWPVEELESVPTEEEFAANITINLMSKPSKVKEEVITMDDFNTVDLKQDLRSDDDIEKINQELQHKLSSRL